MIISCLFRFQWEYKHPINLYVQSESPNACISIEILIIIRIISIYTIGEITLSCYVNYKNIEVQVKDLSTMEYIADNHRRKEENALSTFSKQAFM